MTQSENDGVFAFGVIVGIGVGLIVSAWNGWVGAGVGILAAVATWFVVVVGIAREDARIRKREAERSRERAERN